MGMFFTGDEEKLVNKIEELNKAVKQAKVVLEYTSDNPQHLIEYYKQVLGNIAKSYDPDFLVTLTKEKYGLKSDKELLDLIVNKVK